MTDRYHGAVFAVQAGTPFLPLAGTTDKTAGLVADLDYPLAVQPALTAELRADTTALETLIERDLSRWYELPGPA